METILEGIKRYSDSLESEISELVQSHSTLYRLYRPGDGFMHIGGDKAWRDLPPEGRQLQTKLLRDLATYFPLIGVLTGGVSNDQVSQLGDYQTVIDKYVQQNGMTWAASKQEVVQEVIDAFRGINEVISHLYDKGNGDPVFVPDTNALLANPDIDRWTIPACRKFIILLLPTVLSELDQLKVTHRVEDVRKKAEGIINRIKSYRNRGRLTDGVVLRRDTSTLMAFAVEPRFEHSLPWLDETNNDDRIIAGFIEAMRAFPRTHVALITRDINLQNKAEFARLPFEEPSIIEIQS